MKHLSNNDFNDNLLTNVPDGTSPQDAVNKRQLDEKANVDGFNIVQVKDFGSDWNAVKAAWAVSKHIELERGVTYQVDSALEASGEDVTIIGNGAKLHIVEEVNAFKLQGGWQDIQNIPAFAPDRMSITVSNGGAYRPGDVVKIVNEQALPAFTAQCKKGEFTTVSSVSGNTVSFSAPLRHSYSTGSAPRIGKVNKARIFISDVVLEMQRGYTDAADFYPPEGMIAIEAALEPVIRDVKSLWCYRDTILLRSCYGYRVTNLEVDFSANRAEGYTDMLGYGIRVSASESGYIDRCSFRNSRHGVVYISSTDGGYSGGLTGYGEAAHNVCSNSIGTGCSNSPFDTHHGCYMNKFVNCHTYRNKKAGYQVRGIGTIFMNCTSEGDERGLFVFVQSGYSGGLGLTDMTQWIGCSIFDPRIDAISSGADSGGLLISGGVVQFSPAVSGIRAYSIGARTQLQLVGEHVFNCYGSTAGADSVMRLNGEVELRINGWEINYDGVAGFSDGTVGDIPLILNNGSASSIATANINVRTVAETGHFRNFYSGSYTSGSDIGSATFFSMGDTIIDGIADETLLSSSSVLRGPFGKRRPDTIGLSQSGIWRNWSPTYSGSGSMNFSSVTTTHARYCVVGRIVYFSISARGTTSGTMHHTLQASLPIPAAQSASQPAATRDSTSGAAVLGSGQVTSDSIGVRKADGSNYTAGDGRMMVCHGFYEAG